MRIIKSILFILFVIQYAGCYGSGFKAKYLPIDSVSEEEVGAKIYLDLIDSCLRLKFHDSIKIFSQDYEYDSTVYFSPKFLNYKDSVISINLFLNRIVNVQSDSIFVSANFYITDLEEEKVIRKGEFEEIGIAKESIKGVVVGPTRKQERKFFLIYGVLALISVFFMISSGSV